MTTAKGFRKTYVFKVLLAIDIFMCALLSADTNITISAKCGLALRRRQPGVGRAIQRAFGRLLNVVVPGHCERAIESDLARALHAVRVLGDGE